MSQPALPAISLKRCTATPCLLFSLGMRELVWGVGILEPSRTSETEQQTASLDLHPPRNQNDSTLPLPQATCEIRGKLLLGVEWQNSGAKLELHSVRSLVLPVSRFYELKKPPHGDLNRPVGDPKAILWTLQVWALPPANTPSTGIPVCKIEISELKSIPFMEHKLKLERPVEVFWPESWIMEAGGLEEAIATEVQDPGHSGAVSEGLAVHSLAMRCRHAMFDGATENGATARSLKHWAELESWFLFGPGYARYDDELLPIDEVTSLHPNGEFALTQSDILELRQDENYMFCHSTVVRFVLLSWGWDVETGELANKDEINGQGWIHSGRHAWRLRHLCLSCWLLGQDELRETCNEFVMSLGADAPWTEDGFSEALFTLNDAQRAEDFWLSRAPPGCPTEDPRTLQGILLADDLHLDQTS